MCVAQKPVFLYLDLAFACLTTWGGRGPNWRPGGSRGGLGRAGARMCAPLQGWAREQNTSVVLVVYVRPRSQVKIYCNKTKSSQRTFTLTEREGERATQKIRRATIMYSSNPSADHLGTAAWKAESGPNPKSDPSASERVAAAR